MTDEQPYPIGEPGTPWGAVEREQWLSAQSIKRSYAEEVVAKLGSLEDRFDVSQYGSLSLSSERYPLFCVRSRNWQQDRRTVLVTGGVHGYETSGVQGAIRFAQADMERYSQLFNLVVAPCVSPWGYETINRWNPGALDPNRSFYADTPSEEAAALMSLLASLDVSIHTHVDLHETTDTDNSEFRPALAARDAKFQSVWDIPDGFYTVGDADRPVPDFQKAIIDSVSNVTHIAPADSNGTIIGETQTQPGVIYYAARPLGLCMGQTDAKYVTTTEVYPDSPKVDDENCILAQVAAVTGALDFVQSEAARR